MNKFKHPLAKISGTHMICPKCGDRCVEQLVSSDGTYMCLDCVNEGLKGEGRIVARG